jgi:archaellum component FlaC
MFIENCTFSENRSTSDNGGGGVGSGNNISINGVNARVLDSNGQTVGNNTIFLPLLVKDSVPLIVNASDAMSGLAEKAYSFDGGQTWQQSNAKTYDSNIDGIVVKVKDAIENIATYETINIIKIDKTAPTNAKITVKDREYASFLNTITFGTFFKETVNVSITADSNISGVNKIEYQKVSKESDYNPNGTWISGNSFNVTPDEKFVVYAKVTDNAGNYVIVNTDGVIVDVTKPALAKDSSLNEVTQTADIKVDKTLPAITGTTQSLSYFIGRVIKINDAFGEIAEATYQNGTGSKTSFKNSDLFEKAGKYILTLRDKAGNLDSVSFEMKELPKVEDVVYTADCKALIDSIRVEFDKHNNLPEPYKTDTENKIKALEGRYSQLSKEVTEIKTETSVIKGKVDKFANGVDGLLNLQKEIKNEYNKIAGNASPLTAEEKKALEKEAEYLKQQLNLIGTLQNQIDNIKIQVSNIDTKDNGLILQEGKMKGLLSDIEKLTKEQQSILQPQIDLSNSLLGKSATLKEQVKNLKEMYFKYLLKEIQKYKHT